MEIGGWKNGMSRGEMVKENGRVGPLSVMTAGFAYYNKFYPM